MRSYLLIYLLTYLFDSWPVRRIYDRMVKLTQSEKHNMYCCTMLIIIIIIVGDYTPITNIRPIFVTGVKMFSSNHIKQIYRNQGTQCLHCCGLGIWAL